MLKGTIHVDSVFNEGTKFTLLIPVTVIRSSQKNPVSETATVFQTFKQSMPQEKNNRLVLLVEDNPIALKNFGDYFTAESNTLSVSY